MTIIPVKTIKWVAANALFNIYDGAAPPHELAKMEQIGIDWMTNVAPHQNYGRVISRWWNLEETQGVVQVPPQVVRVLRVGIKVGNHTYSLSVDPNLALPDSIEFDCDPFNDTDNPLFYPIASGFPPFRSSIPYNTNYYRYVDGRIVFNPPPTNGRLYMEWLEAAGHDGDAVVHAGYVNSLRLYMMARYYEMKMGGAADVNTKAFSRYERLVMKYDNDYWEDFRMAKTTVKCPKIDDILDTVRGWG